jgi:hypothetical protein
MAFRWLIDKRDVFCYLFAVPYYTELKEGQMSGTPYCSFHNCFMVRDLRLGGAYVCYRCQRNAIDNARRAAEANAPRVKTIYFSDVGQFEIELADGKVPTKEELIAANIFEELDSNAFDGRKWVDSYWHRGREIPVTQKYGMVSMVIMECDDEFSSELALDMVPRGGHPATVRESIAFAAKHPDVCRRLPFIALGSWTSSKTSDSRFVAAVNGGEKVTLTDRNFDLDWDNSWNVLYAFG